MSYRLGVDVGGTFTDLVLVAPDGSEEKISAVHARREYGVAIDERTPGDRAGGDGSAARSERRVVGRAPPSTFSPERLTVKEGPAAGRERSTGFGKGRVWV